MDWFRSEILKGRVPLSLAVGAMVLVGALVLPEIFVLVRRS
jgi:hypothetical protein